MAIEGLRSTVFSQGMLLSVLADTRFEESGLSALARALRAVVDPLSLQSLQQSALSVEGISETARPGISADTPALFSQPISLQLDNVLLLSARTAGAEDGFGAASMDATNALFQLLQFGVRDRPPPLSNPIQSSLENAPFGPSVIVDLSALIEQLQADDAEETAVSLKLPDFNLKPTEYNLFGSTYSSVADDSTLDGAYYRRIGLSGGASISLDELVRVSASGSPTHLAISLESELGSGALGQIVDDTGTPIADETVIDIADLADYTYEAPTAPGQDYLGIIELEDTGSDGIYEGRGDFQVAALGIGEEEQRRVDGTDTSKEDVIDYTFYAESGTAVTQVQLEFSGLDSLGFTNAVDAIEGGALRVKGLETQSDGTTNEAVTDLYQSSGDTVFLTFPYAAAESGLAENGLEVEVRALDTDLDIDDVTVHAIFS